jgi:hypothetical protein
MKTYKTLSMTFLLITLLIASVVQVKAQKIEITPFIGYITGVQANTNLGTLHIGDGMDFGGSVDVGLGGGEGPADRREANPIRYKAWSAGQGAWSDMCGVLK